MRSVVSRFWRSTLLWTALLAAGLLLATAASGSLRQALAQAPAWLGMAFVLAAYPGGLAVARGVFDDHPGWVSRSFVLLSAGVSASVLAFVVMNLVAPALIEAPPAGRLGNTHGMDLGELAAALAAARQAAEAGPPTPDGWLTYNHLAFHYVRRVDGMLLPTLLALVGLLTGYWTRVRPVARRLGSLGEWAMGVFLLVATYMAGENGYELIVLRAGGPVEFVGDLVLIVPGALLVGLGLAVAVDRLESNASA